MRDMKKQTNNNLQIYKLYKLNLRKQEFKTPAHLVQQLPEAKKGNKSKIKLKKKEMYNNL